MRRMILSALVVFGVARPLASQPVPARDLWDFPLGALGAPAALSSDVGAGLWNPAAGGLRESERWRATAASLSTGAEQGVGLQWAAFAWRHDPATTLSLAIGRAAVDGLVRTDNDPQSVGTIAYQSLLASLGVTRTVLPGLSVGVAARWRDGRADQLTRRALAADVGAEWHHEAWRDLRVGLGTFLWRPGREAEDRPVVSAAFDAVATRWDEDRALRLGYALQTATRGVPDRTTTEHGPVASMSAGPMEFRGALPIVETDGRRTTRVRFAVTLRYRRYSVGVGREDSGNGLAPLYQFTLNVFDR